jgi:hypothetical protein
MGEHQELEAGQCCAFPVKLSYCCPVAMLIGKSIDFHTAGGYNQVRWRTAKSHVDGETFFRQVLTKFVYMAVN